MIVDERMNDIAKLLDVAALRARVHAENLANQNTPGYRARAVRFDATFREVFARRGAVAARAVEPEIFEPRTTAVDNDGNDVSTDREVTEAAQNAMLYQTYISILRGKKTILDRAIRGPA
jgi:flagellar basal-body rod protein FlgB